tara:strand:+ start:358 stop:702 length:345 start_codon:yes stop_codon:yes gene_type:complete
MMQRQLAHFLFLLLCGIGLTACPTERFRHEKYECNSGAFGIAEIIVNDTGVGDMAKIIGFGHEQEVKILSSSKSVITTRMDGTSIKIDRDTGTVKVKRGKHYAVLTCFKSVFTM